MINRCCTVAVVSHIAAPFPAALEKHGTRTGPQLSSRLLSVLILTGLDLARPVHRTVVSKFFSSLGKKK